MAPRDPRDMYGVVRCPEHHEPAIELTSHQPHSDGRVFYKCTKEKCKFFFWKDNLPAVAPQAPPPSQESPRPSQRQRAVMALTPSTPSSPSKRPRSMSPPATPTRQGRSEDLQGPRLNLQTPATPSSKVTPSQRLKRLQDIEAGLSGTKPSNSRTAITITAPAIQPVAEDLGSVPPSPAKRSRIESHSGSRAPSEDDAHERGQGQPDAEAFFLGSQSRGVDGERPSTPPPYAFRNPPPEAGGPHTPGPSGAHGTSESGMLLTPPRSSQLEHAPSSQLSYANAPETPTKPKGKGKAADSTNSAWNKIQADSEHPFHGRAAALRASTRVDAGPRADSDKSPQQLSADIVSERIAALADVPEYVRRLEGEYAAAKKSVEGRDNKIDDLQQEVLQLKKENAHLLDAMSSMRTRLG